LSTSTESSGSSWGTGELDMINPAATMPCLRSFPQCIWLPSRQHRIQMDVARFILWIGIQLRVRQC
jgi:hypothetical protein